MAKFELPRLSNENDQLRWGPSEISSSSDELDFNSTISLIKNVGGMPLAPFNKSDRIGRAADWMSDSVSKEMRDGRFAKNRFREQYIQQNANTQLYTFQHAEDESTFSVVDRNSALRSRFAARAGGTLLKPRGRGGTMNRQGQSRLANNNGTQRDAYHRRQGFGNFSRGGPRKFGWKDYDKSQRLRDASIVVKHDWQLLEEIEFSRLTRLTLDANEMGDIQTYGFIYPYEKTYDKISTKSEKPLQPIDRVHFHPTTTDDPVIQQLANSNQGQVFATSSILSTLMCASRSVYPWDIIVIRDGNKVFFDKRERYLNPFDFITVNENASEPPMETPDGSKETLNSPQALSLEATYIDQNFSFQVINENSSEQIDFDSPNPFYSPADEQEPCAAKGYRYRSFDISMSSESPLNLIVRTEVDGYARAKDGSVHYLTLHALNEFDSKAQGASGAADWRSKIDTQRGGVIATEMKNNSCKLSRWTFQAILAGAESMKLGFVSRVNPRLASRHSILGVYSYKPRDFASQMNLDISNGWGIVRTIVDMCLAQPEGKYVLIKDPNKPILRFYSCPKNTFEDDGEDSKNIDDSETEQM